jgi:hypothetical protein
MTLTIPSDLDMAELDELQTTMQVTLNLQGVCDIIVREPSTLTMIVLIHSTSSHSRPGLYRTCHGKPRTAWRNVVLSDTLRFVP